jgi:N-acyl-D-amino-acid deacylase
MLPKVSQGITTVVTGNCGISLAPFVVPQPEPPLNLLGADSFRSIRSMPMTARGRCRAARRQRRALIGHTTLRFATAWTTSTAPATPTKSRACARCSTSCMAGGAPACPRACFTNPPLPRPPKRWWRWPAWCRASAASTARTCARDGSIIEALHEAGDTAFSAGVPLIVSHHKCAGPANWGRTQQTLPLIESLAARQPVAMDVYPYVAGSTVLREDLVDGVIDVLLSWSTRIPR